LLLGHNWQIVVKDYRMRPGLHADFWGMLVFNRYQWNQTRKKEFGNPDQQF